MFQKERFGDFSCPRLHGPLAWSVQGGSQSHQEGPCAYVCGDPSPLVHNPQSPPPASAHSTHCPLVRDEPGEETPKQVLKMNLELFGQEFQSPGIPRNPGPWCSENTRHVFSDWWALTHLGQGKNCDF